MRSGARKEHRRERDHCYKNSDRALLDSKLAHWPSRHTHLQELLLLPTALPDLMSGAMPHCLHKPTSADPQNDSIHDGPCLYWRCELYERLWTIVKTKKRFIEQKNRFIYSLERASG